MFSEVAEIAQVAQWRGQFQHLVKTQVILILNFTRIHCDYLFKTYKPKLVNFWILKTATIAGQGHRSRTPLNLLSSFFHLPNFWKRSFTTRCYSSCFHFCSCWSCPLILRFKKFTSVFGLSPHGSTGTLTMLWRNSWSPTGQMHEKLTSICFFTITER